jgi:hypothetical protein
MNLKCNNIFNISIIKLSNIHFVVKFNGSIMIKYERISRLDSLMNCSNDDTMFVMETK